MLGLIPAAVLAFVSSFAAAAAGDSDLFQLTPANFDTEIVNGHWFVEHFSPYCVHCKHFLPTWEKLVKVAVEELPEVRLAQINCIEYGDLCEKNGITGYPSVLLFEDGKIVEKYKGAREVPDLMAYLKEHVHKEDAHDEHDEPHPNHHEEDDDDNVPAPPSAPSHLNPSGEVMVLTKKTFASTLEQGPTFVKFYAPWCGHCKKLAPIWASLAKELKGQMQIAEVDCDAEGSLCKANNIQGYPTLVYFAHGSKSDYHGGRKLEQLKAFAEKASADALQPITKLSELQAHVHDEQVVYLLLYTSSSSTDILNIVRQDAAVLLGSPRILTSPSSSLRNKYAVAKHVPWALIALKDHNLDTPSAVLPGTPTTSRTELKKWLLANKLPGYLELTQDTFQSVMNAPHAPLVVVVPSNERLESKIESRVREMSRAWRDKTRGTGLVGGREVVWAWMDGERWGDWMKSMYGLKIGQEEGDVGGVKVVVASHKDLVYYDQDPSGTPFTLSAPSKIYDSLSHIASGALGYKHSENAIERLARHLNTKITQFEEYVVEYPFRFVGMMVCVLGVVFWVLYKWVGSDVAQLERGDYLSKSKNGRLD